ncbi:TIGR01621 family pseudouridine synthase [Chitinimonas arctica]|uniref:TIGR01621 family pseudouridine synthase n=1 Tax=Chitinimonas arctica TaxID=2594795 RepID=A0A516SGX8_9NEIS|nr:TIGR01621 family pseudouridine synthase [Chitinimonas arctica]QDQ27405.1 TIGR01621 family pseudouridine synthase [Chitinimonas arctica]
MPVLPILAEDPRFILINKPAGLSFHTEADCPGVLAVLRAQTGLSDLHAVHRLDQLTSGLLLFARGPEAAAQFGALFAERRISKHYLALSDRSPKKKQGLISGDMQKGRNGSWRLLPSRQDPATTRFYSSGLGNGLRLFLLRPLTGRTHQLRVALKSLGSPILGDSRYAGSPADRAYLHAYTLEFGLGDDIFRFVCPPEQGEHWQTEACRQSVHGFAEPWALARA